MWTTQDPRARSTKVELREHKRKSEGNAGEKTGERPSCFIASRESCSIPFPITIKCLFRDIYSVGPMIHHSSMRRNMRSRRVMQWCARGRIRFRDAEWRPVEAPLQSSLLDFADVAWP